MLLTEWTFAGLLWVNWTTGQRIWWGWGQKFFRIFFSDGVKAEMCKQIKSMLTRDQGPPLGLGSSCILTIKYAFSYFSGYFFFKNFQFLHICISRQKDFGHFSNAAFSLREKSDICSILLDLFAYIRNPGAPAFSTSKYVPSYFLSTFPWILNI